MPSNWPPSLIHLEDVLHLNLPMAQKAILNIICNKDFKKRIPLGTLRFFCCSKIWSFFLDYDFFPLLFNNTSTYTVLRVMQNTKSNSTRISTRTFSDVVGKTVKTVKTVEIGKKLLEME